MEPRCEKEAGPIPLVPDVGGAYAYVLDGRGSDDSLVGLWKKIGNNGIFNTRDIKNKSFPTLLLFMGHSMGLMQFL